MRKFIGMIPCFLLPIFLIADRSAEMHLAPYKTYLEIGTYEGQDWRSFEVLPLSRYETFKFAFEHINQVNPVIVELGTSRSFTHGGHKGCNLDDPIFWTPEHIENWDWGAGFFTRMVSICLAHQQPQIHTVDLIQSHIERCQIMTQDYQHLIQYHVSSSEDFLRNCYFPHGIDLLYLDTGDMTPIESTAQLQLAEARIIVERNLVAKNGIILIDDVKNQTPKKFGEKGDLGKSKYALPYLLENGFELVMDEYQVILRRK